MVMGNLFRAIGVVFAVAFVLPTVGHAGQCPGTYNARTWTNCIGTYTDGDGGKYVGEWKDSVLNGQGTFTYSNGTKYVGEFKDGKMNGQGTYTFANGGKYVGEFKDGKMNGQGTYTFADGSKYVGEREGGKMNGQGTYYYLAEDQYKGDTHMSQWRDGNPFGRVTYIFANGDKYEGGFKVEPYNSSGGGFKDANFHGEGTLTYANGTVKEGIWKNGEFQYARIITPTVTTKNSPKSTVLQFNKSPKRPNDIAVIIGNADYTSGKDIPNVIPAYADAEGIKNYVIQALGILPENIIFLKDASQGELTATFGSATNHKGQLYNYVKPGKSKVFVYYSGHGAPGGEDGSSYIVPTDAQASMIDLNGYPLSTLYKNLGQIPAKSVTVVLEACFSGASQSGSVITQASPIYLKAKETTIPSNITVIAAGAANQIASWEQDSSSGLFTKYFLKGMSGEADAKPYGNGDGKVGYGELGAYFKETLTYFARRYYGRDQTVQIVEGGL